MCESKTCSKCGQTKSTTEFNKDRRNKRDGLQSYCKACIKAYYEANRERQAAANKAWHEANRERRAAYYEANRERRAAASKAWYEANRERTQARFAKNRAIKLGIEGPHFTEEQWKGKLQQHNHTCHYCGKQDDRLTVDHVIPLTDPNSSNSIDNVVPCCQSCNSRKLDRPVEQFLAELRGSQDNPPCTGGSHA